MSLPKSIQYALPENTLPNKATWELNPYKAALLVHDMQHYFLNCYDRAAEPMCTVLNNIKRLVSAARTAAIPIIYTAQRGNQPAHERALLTDFWGKGLADEPSQTDIIAELAPHEDDVCLDKWRYSAFKKTKLHELLSERECNQLIIVGVYGHIGCLSTALEAFMLDIKPFIPGDAIADFSLEDHLMSLSYIANRCGFVTRTDRLISVLEGKKTIPETMSAMKQLLGSYLNRVEHDIADNVYLPDLGLDSIRVMQLAEQWQSHGISFLSLIQNPTPEGWLNLLLAGD